VIEHHGHAGERSELVTRVLVGGICGLAWAAGLRGFMVEVAGPESTVHWEATFGGILLPGVIVGGLLGWAEHLRRTGGRRRWRWLALSPLLLAGILFSRPGDMASLLDNGIGGGAIGVPLIGMAGGYALSGRGSPWARAAAGTVAAASIPIWALTAASVGGPELALDTPRGAWVALYLYSFLVVLMLASAIPHRTAVRCSSAPRPDTRCVH
jgi:hypothetical protein